MPTKDATALISIDKLRQALSEFMALDPVSRSTVIGPLGAEFFEAAEQGNLPWFKVFLENDFDVNYQDARTGKTALHYAAASNAVEVITALNKTEKCDYLIRDVWGRLPSELAYTSGENWETADLLGNKERDQAAQQGIKLTRRP